MHRDVEDDDDDDDDCLSLIVYPGRDDVPLAEVEHNRSTGRQMRRVVHVP